MNDPSVKIANNELAFAIPDGYPVSLGHTLIIPKRHIKSYFDLTNEELIAIYDLAKKVKKTIIKTNKPEGFNIGFNDGEVAGQTIMHCHMHIIPRYKDDVVDPRGGIRGVIPSKQKY
jgi:diadenosine tetraphosphate (Ap4A) HIT family hydrolase